VHRGVAGEFHVPVTAARICPAGSAWTVVSVLGFGVLLVARDYFLCLFGIKFVKVDRYSLRIIQEFGEATSLVYLFVLRVELLPRKLSACTIVYAYGLTRIPEICLPLILGFS